jgi:DNA topoisomerase-2
MEEEARCVREDGIRKQDRLRMLCLLCHLQVSGASMEELYQKKTPIEHVLLRPDSYIGTTQATTDFCWVIDESSSTKVVKKECNWVPGLYKVSIFCRSTLISLYEKIFDEILVNAADNKQRDPKGMNEIRINIDAANGTISVYNNGRGIPIQFHKKEGNRTTVRC